MKIYFFGRLADSFGPDIDFPIEESCSVDELRRQIATQHPDASSLLDPPVRACVADTIVGDNHILHPSDSLEFLPPVSGG